MTAMLLLMLHFLTLAVLGFGYVQSIPARHALPIMAWGARLQLISGLIMAAYYSMAKPGGEAISPTFYAVKLIIMIVILALVEISAARGKKGREDTLTLVHAAAALTVLNFIVAYAFPK